MQFDYSHSGIPHVVITKKNRNNTHSASPWTVYSFLAGHKKSAPIKWGAKIIL
jgi:hypothetical protein